MTVNLKVWSDNHDKEAMFGTEPNKPHLVVAEEMPIDKDVDLLDVLIQWFRKKFAIDPKEEIRIKARNSYAPSQGIEEVRLWVAENEYVCQAVVGL